MWALGVFVITQARRAESPWPGPTLVPVSQCPSSVLPAVNGFLAYGNRMFTYCTRKHCF